uniref:HTH luxR-type domain-containing protein n=1 Tax=Globodera pallida TaxID=36090 RepID=A0A183CSH1_GLOPA
SSYDEQLYALPFLKAGANGYISKTAVNYDFAQAVEQVLSGRTYASPEVMQHAFKQLFNAGTAEESKISKLSERELEVARLLVKGASTKIISQRLSLSPSSISTYKAKIFERLGVTNGQQQLPAGYWVQHFTDENGLPQNSVKAILRDGNGFIWLTTEAGVVRFDGHSFLTFDRSDLPISSNRIGGINPFAGKEPRRNSILGSLPAQYHVDPSSEHYFAAAGRNEYYIWRHDEGPFRDFFLIGSKPYGIDDKGISQPSKLPAGRLPSKGTLLRIAAMQNYRLISGCFGITFRVRHSFT